MILDYKQQPYVELKADGTVSVNTNSEAYYLNEDRQGETAVPKNLGSEPKWKEIAKSGRYEWHDHRMHWMGAGDPPNLDRQGQGDGDLRHWQIPIQVAGTAGDDQRHADLGPARRRRPAAGRDLRLRRADHRALDRGLHRPPPARARAAATARRARPRREGARGGVVRRARSRRSPRSLARPRACSPRVRVPRTRRCRRRSPSAARSSTPRPTRSCSASTSPSRPRSARCASSTPRATRSRPARPSTPAAAARRSRSSSSPASATAATPRPTASCPPTGTPISSGFVFAVGDSTAPAESLETLLADSGTGPVTNTALAFARGFQYAAIALGLGTLIFFLYCWRGAVDRVHAPARAAPARRRARRLALRGRRGGPAGRRRPGRDVLGRRQAGRRERGARHPLRPRLGHRRRGLAGRARRARAAPAAGRGCPRKPRPGEVSEGTEWRTRTAAEPTPVPSGPAAAGPRRGAVARRRSAARARRRRAPRAHAQAARARHPARSRSRCCPRSAATPACRSRWRSCCRRTSCTCWR